MESDLELIAKRRVQARLGFFVHLAVFVATNTGLIAIWMATGTVYPWFVWPIVFWSVGVVGHAMALAIGPDSTTERRAIDREVRRMRAFEH
jgi:hypothetical protein